MNANLTLPSISTLSPSGGNVAPIPTPTDGAPKTEEFAAVLTGQMFKAERQGLAAQAISGPGLQVVSLGAKLNVITTDEPLPDLPSLATFARAQGLDEVAIQALFGSTVGVNVGPKSGFSVSGLGQSNANKPVTGMTLAVPLPQIGKGNFLAIDATPIELDSAALVQGSGLEAPRPPSRPKIGELNLLTEILFDSGAVPEKTMELVDPTQVAVALGASNPQLASTPQPAPIPLTVSSSANGRAIDQASTTEEPIGVAIAGWASLGPGSTSKAVEARPGMRLDASAEESIQDAIRVSITVPAKDILKRPPNTANTTETINWPALLSGASANKVAVSNTWETLHLTVPEGFDLEEQGGALEVTNQDTFTAPGTQQQPEGSAAKPGAATAHPLRGEASAAAAQTELRTVQQQQLADRLGEAAAHRLIAQIERGEWKMQMRLQPGKLGKIDVELTMHARGLEAMFSADSALTRELIAQGSARLKDTLTQAGMTVASVTVNGDQASQSGGNSTPRHGNQTSADTRPVKVRAEAQLASPETSPTRTNDRLNILA